LGGGEHGLERHAEKFDDGTTDEQQSPERHCKSPSEFVRDQHGDQKKGCDKDRHNAAIAWSKPMRVNRREAASDCGPHHATERYLRRR